MWGTTVEEISFHCKQEMHPGFETQGRHHKKSKTGVSVAPQKGLVSYKNFYEKKLQT